MTKPFRLLYLGMYWDYGDPARDLSHEETNFHNSFRSWPKAEVTHFDFVELEQLHGRDRMNQMLLEESKKGYDALFCVMYKDQLDEDVLHQISRQGTVTIAWGCDDHWRFDNFSSRWAPHFDYWVTTASSAVRRFGEIGIGEKVIKSQWACATDLYRPWLLKRDVDASFIGQPHSNRRELVSLIESQGIPLTVFGHGWGEGSRVSIGTVIELFNRSKVNLNLSNASRGEHSQIKGRVFEVTGCGGLLLTDTADDLETYFELGKELVIYDSPQDLVEKARYYIRHDTEREQIAAAGLQRVLRDHTWHRRFDDIFAKAGVLGV